MSSGYYRIDEARLRREERKKEIDSECISIERWLNHFWRVVIRDNLEKYNEYQYEYEAFKKQVAPGNEINETTYTKLKSSLLQLRQKRALLEAANEFEIKVELSIKHGRIEPFIERPADSLDVELKKDIDFMEELKRTSEKQQRLRRLREEVDKFKKVLPTGDFISLMKEADEEKVVARVLSLKKDQYVIRRELEVLKDEINLLSIFTNEEKKLREFLKDDVIDIGAYEVLEKDIRRKLEISEVQKACEIERKFREKFGNDYSIHFEIEKQNIDGTKGYFLKDKRMIVRGKGAVADFFVREEIVVDAKELGDRAFCKDMKEIAETMGGEWHENGEEVRRRRSELQVQRMEN